MRLTLLYKESRGIEKWKQKNWEENRKSIFNSTEKNENVNHKNGRKKIPLKIQKSILKKSDQFRTDQEQISYEKRKNNKRKST